MLLGKIKLYDIAKEFDMSSKDILAIAVKLNIDAKSHLSSVSDEDAEKIRKRLMPLWIVFLSQKGGASDFKIPKDKKFEKYMDMAQNYNVQNMRFTELMNYCVEHYREYGLDENAFKWKKNETSYDR